MNARTLVASVNGREVGYLRADDGVWAFEYSDAWLSYEGAYALSPHLPLQQKRIVDGRRTTQACRGFEGWRAV